MKTQFFRKFALNFDWKKYRLLKLIVVFVVSATLISIIVEHVEAPREAVNIFPRTRRPERAVTMYAVGNINVASTDTSNWFSEKTDPGFSALLREIASADVAIGSLNCQLTSSTQAAERLRDFSASPESAGSLANAGFDILSTAGYLSSLMDTQSLSETTTRLKKTGIRTVGTGRTIDEAWEPAVIERNGWRIAVFAVTATFNKNYFGLPTQSGLATANIAQLTRQVSLIRQRFDLILISYYGGNGAEAAPVADARTFSQHCIDAGADAVFCQNQPSAVPHEYYEGHPIIYNIGDFPANSVNRDLKERENTGSAVRLIVQSRNPANHKPEFIVQRVKLPTLSPAWN
jgi:poly-gamma-glutamate synthesis protein (capsule biosynthesis protein)